MSEMVERVTKAIMATGIASYDCGEEASPECIGLPDNCRCRNAARAAIEAMREPTEAMNEEGYAAARAHDYGDTVPSHEIAPATWRAMIDAALNK